MYIERAFAKLRYENKFPKGGWITKKENKKQEQISWYKKLIDWYKETWFYDNYQQCKNYPPLLFTEVCIVLAVIGIIINSYLIVMSIRERIDKRIDKIESTNAGFIRYELITAPFLMDLLSSNDFNNPPSYSTTIPVSVIAYNSLLCSGYSNLTSFSINSNSIPSIASSDLRPSIFLYDIELDDLKLSNI